MTNAIETRREKLNAIARRGIPVPVCALADADHDFPGSQTRAWSWWASVWPRPSTRTANVAESILASAQQEWDSARKFVTNQTAIKAEIDKRAADAAREKQEADAATRREEAATLRDTLRAKFLAMPGTTEQAFEAQYSDLLADHRRREMGRQDEGAEQAREATRQRVRNVF